MIDRDLSHLVEPFHSSIRAALQDLRAQGWTPYVAETLRSPERQKLLVQQGLSRTMASLHLQGLAADVVDGRRVGGYRVLWGATDPAWRLGSDLEATRALAARTFFAALGAACHAHGLTWGGDWARFPDLAHVQA